MPCTATVDDLLPGPFFGSSIPGRLQHLDEDSPENSSHFRNNPDIEEDQPSCPSGTADDHLRFEDLAGRKIEKISATSGEVIGAMESKFGQERSGSRLVRRMDIFGPRHE